MIILANTQFECLGSQQKSSPKQRDLYSTTEDVSLSIQGAFTILNWSVEFSAFELYVKHSYVTAIYLHIKLHIAHNKKIKKIKNSVSVCLTQIDWIVFHCTELQIAHYFV